MKWLQVKTRKTPASSPVSTSVSKIANCRESLGDVIPNIIGDNVISGYSNASDEHDCLKAQPVHDHALPEVKLSNILGRVIRLSGVSNSHPHNIIEGLRPVLS